MTNRDTERLVRDLEAQGWEVTLGKRSGHYKAKAPGGGLCFFPSTPSDHRSIRNSISTLRQLGAKL